MNPNPSPRPASIPDQVRLPLSIVWEIVVQGIRIRLGRSVVTVLGVVLGVAFLMSILTAHIIRSQVDQEVQTRQTVASMAGFLTAEAGSVKGRVFAVHESAAPTGLEKRFLEFLRGQGVREFVPFEKAVPGPDGRIACALIVIGGSLPPDLWKSRGSLLGRPLAAFTRPRTDTAADLPAVLLRRPPNPEDAEKQERQAKTDQVRTVWIMSIAVLVTIISISNALLMSVTERFREIGTMKCLGALSSFIRRVFFVESALVGLVGSVSGAFLGLVFAVILYCFTFGWTLVLSSIPWLWMAVSFAGCIAGGVAAAVVAAIYPANFASRMVPATALRSNI